MCRFPAEPNVHDRLELPEVRTEAGDILQDVLFVERFTSPTNPF